MNSFSKGDTITVCNTLLLNVPYHYPYVTSYIWKHTRTFFKDFSFTFMLYFKKNELAETYHVSEKTVSNWIQEAKAGKLDLQLHQAHNRTWIANTTRNITLIEELVESRRKFRNTRGVKVISPKPDFYQRYNQQQIFDIASNLDIHREIPFQYGYFNGGATYWDEYAQRLVSEKTSNNLYNSMTHLRISQDYIDHLLKNYDHVNVIDVGPGNALPVKNLLQHLLESGKLNRYMAVDISPAMLQLVQHNIDSWFGGQVSFTGYQADINYDRFISILTEDALSEQADKTIDVILALGDTFSNFRSADGALRAIHDSMNRNDLFVFDRKLDTEAARRYFDFNIGTKTSLIDAKSKMVLDLLNIDESFYDVEAGYDPERRQRYIQIRLKVALTIDFTFEKGMRAVTLNKNETILLWRSRHQNVPEVLQQLDRNDFDVLHTSLTEDKDYLLSISRVKSEHA